MDLNHEIKVWQETQPTGDTGHGSGWVVPTLLVRL